MLNSECFDEYKDTQSWPGTPHKDIKTLKECKQKCLDDDYCVAVDWDIEFPVNCFLLRTTAVYQPWKNGIITQYKRKDSCKRKL